MGIEINGKIQKNLFKPTSLLEVVPPIGTVTRVTVAAPGGNCKGIIAETADYKVTLLPGESVDFYDRTDVVLTAERKGDSVTLAYTREVAG